MLLAEQLALEFQRQFKIKYNKYPYALSNVKNSKWWVHFVRCQNESKLPKGYERKFIQKLFNEWDKEGVLWPYVLSQQIARNVESSLLEIINSDLKDGLVEADFIKITLDKAKKWCKENSIVNNQIASFLTDDTCMMRANRGEFYQPLFLFSLPYINKYGITDEQQLKKNSIRAFQPKIFNILKQSLQEQFIE